MSTPSFSVPYRAPGIVDVLVPKQTSGSDVVDGYRLKASPQFDGTPAFVTLLTASIGAGYIDRNVDRRKLHTMPGHGHVRATFNPDTFASGQPIDAGLDDTRQFWMRFTPLVGGVEGVDSDPVLVLAPSQKNGTQRIAISGDAPAGASISGSLTLCLARRMKQIVVTNNSTTNALFIAFNEGGPEVQIAAGETSINYDSAQSVLLVRGSGATVNFSATMTVAQGNV